MYSDPASTRECPSNSLASESRAIRYLERGEGEEGEEGGEGEEGERGERGERREILGECVWPSG